jgi:nucleoside-triphosphatase THEP1
MSNRPARTDCILLTGEIHVGKTTVCRSVITLARRRRQRVAGIVSPPVFDHDGVRTAVDIIDLSTGEQRTLARLDCGLDGPSIGPYHFDAQVLDWGHQVVARALSCSCDLLVVDEVGRLELEQDAGLRLVPLLGSGRLPPCLLVVRTSLINLFHRKLPHLNCSAYEITLENRVRAPAEVAALLRSRCSPHPGP